MIDEIAKKPAPAAKRPNCRRFRCEKNDWDEELEVGADGRDGELAMLFGCRKAIGLWRISL